MSLSPYETFEHLKATAVSYLETAYKISHSDLVSERRALLEKVGSVAQHPLIETTPNHDAGRWLPQLIEDHSDQLPAELAELIGFGTPLGTNPLWRHQDEAISATCGDAPNLVVATGTASGKTEIFLTPILARIVNEALGRGTLPAWTPPRGAAERGRWDRNSARWLHQRQHETRPSAIRAIVLYPTNALVNDQVRRMRGVLGSETSEAWQIANLQGNTISLGMYTSETDPTGHWSKEWKRNAWETAFNDIVATWHAMSPELQQTGGWPRPHGPEMLCRWDMQLAPPDLLVTNYSMLEYMLVRPIERQMFDVTKQWLKKPGAVFTLVLDEAHTYRGARGTEIALLIRRLKERLGIEDGSGKLRCIATSASLPGKEEPGQLARFAAALFGEPESSFSVVSTEPDRITAPYTPAEGEIESFAEFGASLEIASPRTALSTLAKELNIGELDESRDAALEAHRLFAAHPQIERLRKVAARQALPLQDVADFLWNGMADPEIRRAATAGVLAVGSFARPTLDADAQPLISSRVHGFFRGVAGLWACMDAKCRFVGEEYRARPSRPVGRLYVEPRIWCDCGARVLEVFSCRVCGLLFLGGIPDASFNSLWPWADDLEGTRQDFNLYEIFGVEEPRVGVTAEYRSTRTTRLTEASNLHSRTTYRVQGTTASGQAIPFPRQCPRCNSFRGRGMEGREIVEPLRTKGSKTFSALVEDAFRLQPAVDLRHTNGGRKALAFSDSRQDAALLAGDLEIDHTRDVFRQIMYRIARSCAACEGYGYRSIPAPVIPQPGAPNGPQREECTTCTGGGWSQTTGPIPVAELRSRMLAVAHRARIDPTISHAVSYFGQLTPVANPNDDEARRWIDAVIRNEIASADIGLEPMGLARWTAQLPTADLLGAMAPLNGEETVEFLQVIIRMLATQDVLLPPRTLSHMTWPVPFVPDWDRKLLVQRGLVAGQYQVEFKLTGDTQIGRYMRVLATELVRTGRFADTAQAEGWLMATEQQVFSLLRTLGVLVSEAGGRGFGISIDRFQLQVLDGDVHQCDACSFVSSSGFLATCMRCGGRTIRVAASSVRNFYRRTVEMAVPGSPYADPFAFKVEEHTAQIEKRDAKRYERWFQNLFLGDEDPDDRRLDALSVTTTMEMGVDIGNLLTVALRNVPPTVANYQQRAGRAGRRGSAVASVVAFAQQRSHDQYHFARPARIISDPPRIPRLYVNNPVISRRHVRALVLQYFFHSWTPTASGVTSGVMNAWGTVTEFIQQNGAPALEAWLRSNRVELRRKVTRVVASELHTYVDEWIKEIHGEVNRIATTAPAFSDLLVELLNQGLMPRHAFPIDVVSLHTQRDPQARASERETGIQRDLSIGLSEFAPGAEVVRSKRIYRVAGLYDPFQRNPNYTPTGLFVECANCRAIDPLPSNSPPPLACAECGAPNPRAIPSLRPPGFCSDWANDPQGQPYNGGGRDRAGFATPARLTVGEFSFQEPASALSPRLHIRVRAGQLYSVNYGATGPFPGFRICPRCGRGLDAQATAHTYPADVPPHTGANRGPRAGARCPNNAPAQNNVILSHSFPSEVVQLGVDLAASMDADSTTASGRAAWLSFGTLLLQAASAVLEIDPDELRVGIRSVQLPNQRIHAEVYLHDTLPGGAGYAREISDSLEEVLREGLSLAASCPNSECEGACYQCLLDYSNQFEHALLDRRLGGDILRWILDATPPALSPEQADLSVAGIREFLDPQCVELGPRQIGQWYLPLVYDQPNRGRVGVLPIHTLCAAPTSADLREVFLDGIDCRVHREFDLVRRPFWVANQL